jgi:hypothetical protein
VKGSGKGSPARFVPSPLSRPRYPHHGVMFEITADEGADEPSQAGKGACSKRKLPQSEVVEADPGSPRRISL